MGLTLLNLVRQKTQDALNLAGNAVGEGFTNVGNYFNQNVGYQPKPLMRPTGGPSNLPTLRSFWTDLPAVDANQVANNFPSAIKSAALKYSPMYAAGQAAGDAINKTDFGKSGLGRFLGDAAGNVLDTPFNVTQGAAKATLGVLELNPQKSLGGVGQWGSAMMNVLPAGKIGGVAETLGKQTLKTSIWDGMKLGGMYGGAQGFLGGLDHNKAKSLQDQLIGAGLETVTNGLLGAATGGVFGAGSRHVGAGSHVVADHLNTWERAFQRAFPNATLERISVAKRDYLNRKGRDVLGKYSSEPLPAWMRRVDEELGLPTDNIGKRGFVRIGNDPSPTNVPQGLTKSGGTGLTKLTMSPIDEILARLKGKEIPQMPASKVGISLPPEEIVPYLRNKSPQAVEVFNKVHEWMSRNTPNTFMQEKAAPAIGYSIDKLGPAKVNEVFNTTANGLKPSIKDFWATNKTEIGAMEKASLPVPEATLAKPAISEIKQVEGQLFKMNPAKFDEYAQASQGMAEADKVGFAKSLIGDLGGEVTPAKVPTAPLFAQEKIPTETLFAGKQQTTGTDQFAERVKAVNTRQEADALQEEAANRISQLVDYLGKKGKTFEQVFNELESGSKNPETALLTKWLDMFKAKAESYGINVGNLENYGPHLSQEGSKTILDKPSIPDTFADVLMKPFFANKRTGKLTDYIKTPDALLAYSKEALKNVGTTPQQQAELKVSQEIINEVKKPSRLDWLLGGTPLQAKVDFVQKIQSTPVLTDVPKVVYDAPVKTGLREGLSETFRFNNDRARMAGQQFYTSFLEPFRQVEMKVNQFAQNIGQMPETELARIFEMNVGKSASGVGREENISRLILSEDRSLRTIATNTFKENVQNAEFRQPWLKNLTNNIFDEYVGDGIRSNGMTEKLLGVIRASTGRATIGLNVTTALNNVFELRRAFSVVGIKESSTALKRVLNGENFAQKYGVDSVSSTALERLSSRNAFGQVMKGIDKGLFYMFDKTEKFKDQIMLAGFEEQGLKNGLKDAALNRYVLQKFDQFAVKYGTGNNIGLYRSPFFKTIFQFGQYPIKDAVILFDKSAGALKGDKGDMAYLFKYAVTSVAEIMALKALLGKIGFGDQTNTPLDLVSNFTKGQVPISPSVQLMIGLGQNIGDGITGTQLSEYDQSQRDSKIQNSLLSTTVPGSNQLWTKTGKAALNQEKGYQEKFGGNVANPVSSDPWSVGKSLVFGPSYDPKRMQYIKDVQAGKATNTAAGLNKTTSAVFKTLPRDEQAAYYDSTVSQNKTTQANQKVIADIKNPPKTGDWLSNLNPFKEKTSTTPVWGAIPKTPQEKKDHKALVTASLEAGQTVPVADLNTSIFNGKNITSASPGEQTKIYSTLKTEMANEFYTPEQKQKILEASGATEGDWNYYQVATSNSTEKLNTVLDWVGTQSKTDRDHLVEAISMGKRQVAGQALIDNTIVDRLYNDGTISKDEKKLIDAIKYDSVYKKFYLDRDYKPAGGTSLAKIRAYVRSVNNVFAKKPVKKTLFSSSTPSIRMPKAPTLNFAKAPSRTPRSTSQWFQAY